MSSSAANVDQSELPLAPSELGRWAGTACLLALLLVSASVPLDWWGLIVLVGMLWFAAFVHAKKLAVFTRRLWLEIYLQPDSTLRSYCSGTTWPTLISLCGTLPLVVSLYVSVFAMPWYEVLFAVAALRCAQEVGERFRYVPETHFRPMFAELIRKHTSALMSLIFVMATLVTVEAVQSLRTSYADETPSSMADTVIAEIKHPVLPIRHWARMARYADLHVLRARDSLGFPIGWGIYLCMLVASIVPILGGHAVLHGLTDLAEEMRTAFFQPG